MLLSRSLRSVALWVHLQHEKAYSYWKVYESGLVNPSRLTHGEREFYLKLRFALQGQALVVYDIGASLGIISGCLAKIPSVAAVHAFEPIPTVYARLVEGMRPYPQVHCHNVAVGDMAGSATMYISKSTDSSSLLPMALLHKEEFPGTDVNDQIQVTVVRLDDYVCECRLPQPDLVKIDVQGYEDRVLRGGSKTIGQARYCVLEMSLQPLYEGAPLFDDIYCLMRDMGFRLTSLAGTLFGKSGRQLQVDTIFENNRIDGDALSSPE